MEVGGRIPVNTTIFCYYNFGVILHEAHSIAHFPLHKYVHLIDYARN